uniref:alpha/beta fold hydrolase n=1 Tax=Candidatus Ventrenecus sp. TaxID=3085654 RepID=UPI0040282967
MQKETIKMNSKQDDLPIEITLYIPEKDIKGIVQISHGMAEHKEKYENFLTFLCQNGFAAAISDHRGHGKSILKKEDLGYFYDETSDFIVEDLHDITLLLKEKYPDKPLILFGHSMGSLVVRKYIQKYDKDIDKLIVCGSPSKNNLVDIAIFLTKIIKSIKGDNYRSKLIQNLAFGSYSKKSDFSDNAWLSFNKDNVLAYDKDEYCGFIFTTNGFLNLFRLMKSVYQKRNYIVQNKDLPIYFIAGENDPVIINKKAWLKSQEFLKSCGYQNITSTLYSHMKHEILNETDKEKVYQDILNFCK